MVLLFITSISVDVLQDGVPPVLSKEAGRGGVGCTTWEVVRNVVIPYTRVGVIGGVMLALGRALGETMAVTFIIGNSFRISGSVFAPGTTISAAIASEFAESDGLHQSGLILLGLLLFVLTFFVLGGGARLDADAPGKRRRGIDPCEVPIYRSPPPQRRHHPRAETSACRRRWLGVTWLALILFTLFWRTAWPASAFQGSLSQPIRRRRDRPKAACCNAIVGSIIMTGDVGVGIGAPTRPVLPEHYLAEYW